MVSVISSTWMLVGGPGGPDRWHNQAGKRKRKIGIERQTEEGARGKGGNVNQEEMERWWREWRRVLAPGATVVESVHCETSGSYLV